MDHLIMSTEAYVIKWLMFIRSQGKRIPAPQNQKPINIVSVSNSYKQRSSDRGKHSCLVFLIL